MTRINFAATQGARRTIRSGVAGVLAATALIGTMACSGSDKSTGPRDNQNPVGTFALFQVDDYGHLRSAASLLRWAARGMRYTFALRLPMPRP